MHSRSIATAAATAAGGALTALIGCVARQASEGIWYALLVAMSVGGAAAALGLFRAFHDVRVARQNLEKTLADRELLLESVEITPTPYALYDACNRLVAWNKSYQDLHEPAFSRLPRPIHYADLMREALRQTLPSDALEAAVAYRLAAQKEADGAPHDRYYSNGSWYRVCKMRTRSGAVAGFAADITELKRREVELAASAARYRALAETSPTGIWCIADDGEPLYANRALLRLMSHTETPCGQDMQRMLAPLSEAMLAERQSSQGPGRYELELHTAQGEARQVLVTTTGWLCVKGERGTCTANIVDITVLKAAQRRIEHLATHDVLTGLANRALLNSTLERLTSAEAAREALPVALVVIDLDHFKEINDVYGHAAGDAVLCTAADRMRANVRPSDLVCRLGGDEFAIVLMHTSAPVAGTIADQLLGELTRPFALHGVTLSVGASLGIALYPDDARSADELIRNADIALYRSKREGRCTKSYFAEPALPGHAPPR